MPACNKNKCSASCNENHTCPAGPPGELGPAGVPEMPYQARVQLMETTTKPVEQLLAPNELAQIFIELAKTGIKKLDFSSPALQDLSFQIVKLVAENKHLRKMLKLDGPDDLDVKITDAEFHIKFGPYGSYELRIPIENNGPLFVERLRRVANELEAGQKNSQLSLFDY